MANALYCHGVAGWAHDYGSDEGLMFFVSSHNPFRSIFYPAVGSMVSGLPLGFIEYAGYLSLLRTTLPFAWVMEHIDGLGRLPLLFCTFITAASVYAMSFRANRSLIWSATLALLFAVLSPLAAHLSGELRFHSFAQMHIAIAWLAFAFVAEGEWKWLPALAWFFAATSASWTHPFGNYSVALQLAWLCFLGVQQRSWKLFFRKVPFLVLVVLSSYLSVSFVRHFSLAPSPRGAGDELGLAFQRVSHAASQVIYPSWPAWVLICGYLGYAGRRFWVLAFTLLQIVTCFALGFLVNHFQWGPPVWYPRYMMASLIPVAYGLSLLVGSVWSDRLERRTLPWIAPAWIALAFILPPHAYFTPPPPGAPKTQWAVLVENLLALNAYGKCQYVMGLLPSPDHSLQAFVSGEGVGHVWQIYGKGPWKIAHVDTYRMNSYGGLTGLSCQQREKYPVASSGGARQTDKVFILDFCDPEHFNVREKLARLASR